MKQLNQSYIWAVAAVALILVGVFYFWQIYKPQQSSQENIIKGLGEIAVPKVNVITNPTENLPEVNLVEKANPFTKTYQNPFE